MPKLFGIVVIVFFLLNILLTLALIVEYFSVRRLLKYMSAVGFEYNRRLQNLQAGKNQTETKSSTQNAWPI